ncbi:hypothetical protein G7B40_010225 [Aetokthonos hydrillicola Thurmond2011]|uniref:Uncharacterized protein n=1 Tax=Aetokthonos hydrillicola Thurmond2011 TaxID=2712845 RepID=A0AAP5I540_9CYAN|nr:hypothetical protein [Aetokthonos hydrillicola]MBO3458995.1 hypothetical protein [Aetokthonos hydrillicola CCALA 1050]MBW4589103.1 hypothetical protein [Aetokthonos hydrillicola CCALA 1050]MDR9894941.1 hypothetical protein [Aetokthonos hydrillicola Thurmond2011]
MYQHLSENGLLKFGDDIELLTIFPDDSPECDDFLENEASRKSEEDSFQKLW